MDKIRSNDVASILRRRIQWGLHLGLIRSGDRLPSLRAASAEFGADQRSVLSAYRALEIEGIVELRPRSGIYVAEGAPRDAARSPEQQWLLDMFSEGFRRGISPAALGPMLTAAITGRKRTAACVECNVDSALAISKQLADDFGVATSCIDPDKLGEPASLQMARAADFIVTTHFHVGDTRPVAAEVRRPLVVIASDRDHSAQIRSALGRGPTYIVGVDPRLAEKLSAAWGSARWLANFRPLVVGRDDPTRIPAGSTVFVTRAAKDEIGLDAVPRGATVLNHEFSAETRSSILGLLLAPPETRP